MGTDCPHTFTMKNILSKQFHFKTNKFFPFFSPINIFTEKEKSTCIYFDQASWWKSPTQRSFSSPVLHRKLQNYTTKIINCIKFINAKWTIHMHIQYVTMEFQLGLGPKKLFTCNYFTILHIFFCFIYIYIASVHPV